MTTFMYPRLFGVSRHGNYAFVPDNYESVHATDIHELIVFKIILRIAVANRVHELFSRLTCNE